MQRLGEFFKNPVSASVLLTGLSILPIAIRFFLLPFYLNELEPKEYGILAIIYLVSSFFELFGNLRLQTAVQTYYFDYIEEPKKLQKYISNVFSFSLLVSFGLLVLFFIFGAPLLDLILKSNQVSFFPDVTIALLTSFLLLNIRIYFAYIKNKKFFLEYAQYSISLVLLNIIFQLFFLFGMKMGITGILLGSLTGTFIVFLVFIIKHYRLLTFDLKKKFILPSLKYSIVLLPFVIFFWANQKIDRFFLERLLDMEWVGKYAVLVTITGLVMTVVNAGISSFRPFLFGFYKKGVKENAQNIILLEKVFLYLVFLGASFIILVGSNLNLIISKPKYLEIIHLIPLATCIPILMGLAMLFNQQLIFSKNAKRISGVSLISFLIVTPLYYLVIPDYKLEGLICTNILGNGIVTLLFYYYGKKYFPVQHDLKTLLLLPITFYTIVFGLKYFSDTAIISYGLMGLIQWIIITIGILAYGRKDLFSFLKFKK